MLICSFGWQLPKITNTMTSPDPAVAIVSDEDEDDEGKTPHAVISFLSDGDDGDENFSCPVCWEDFDQQIEIALLPMSCEPKARHKCLQV